MKRAWKLLPQRQWCKSSRRWFELHVRKWNISFRPFSRACGRGVEWCSFFASTQAVRKRGSHKCRSVWSVCCLFTAARPSAGAIKHSVGKSRMSNIQSPAARGNSQPFFIFLYSKFVHKLYFVILQCIYIAGFTIH